MSERVQQLLYEVRRAASEDDYKRQLRQRFPDANSTALASLQREIAEEIAYSLGRAGAKIERSITLLEALLTRASALDVSGSPLSDEERDQVHSAFVQERALAERHLRDLLLQREALGFRRHDDVLQRWVIPRWRALGNV